MNKYYLGEVWLNRLLLMSASVIPLYLSMFSFKLGGVTFRLADFIALSVILITFLKFPSSRKQVFNVRMIPIYGLVLFILFQSLFLGNHWASIKEIVQLSFVSLFLLVNMWLMSFNKEKYIKLLLIFLSISVTYTVLFHLLHSEFFRYKLAGDGKYAFGFLSVFAFLNWKKSNENKFKIVFILSLIPLVFSLERKGILGVLLVLIAYSGAHLLDCIRIESKHVILLLCGLLVPLFAIFFVEVDAFINNKIYMQNFLDESLALYTSNIHRESLLVNGWSIFSNNIIFGVGADNITKEMGQFYIDSRLAGGTHNFYLDSLVKYGIIGAVFLAMLQLFSLLKGVSRTGGMFILYCLFVAAFMSDGQSVLILYMLPVFSNHILFNLDSK